MGAIGQDLAIEIRAKGLWQILLFAAGLLLLGYGCQQAYWSGTRGWRKHVLAIPLDTVENRLKVVGQRLAYNLLWLLSFAVGSLGALLLFSWPPYLKTVLSAIFLIIVIALLWGALARFVLSPNNPKLRVFPTSRRLSPALEPLGRDPAGLVLRRLHGHAGPAGLRRGQAGHGSRWPTPGAGPVRSGHDGPVAPAGPGP